MGQESIVTGHICASTYQPPEGEKLYRLNEKLISEFPNEDNYPWITKWMFGTIPYETQSIYRNQIIHFGASYKQVEPDWHIWIEKFENLLSKLYWSNAYVHLETDYIGEYEYKWVANWDNFDKKNPKPTTSWVFEGGPRDFSAMLNK